jgi:hypothetical protein
MGPTGSRTARAAEQPAWTRRLGIAALLLGLWWVVSPRAQALTPGPTLIQQCPSCTNAVRQFTIGSGNTFGARFWTDGYMDAPMLPLLPALVKCPHCKELIWIEDAKELGEVGWGTGNEDKWSAARAVKDPDEGDYLKAAAEPKLARDREIYARRRAWWLANGPARDNPKGSTQWTPERKKNLERLSSLLDTSKDDELIAKAEIARELGNFDQCRKLLGRRVGKDWRNAASLIKRLAKEKKDRVELLPSGGGGAIRIMR